MRCLEMCKIFDVSCPNEGCRYWLDYERELNCALKSVEEHGELTLRQCGERLGISYVRVKQIEDGALKKIEHLKDI
tara:strand:- start:156 stop:383 length:228 start_codon:yes stop_codon:yes gene_type:complete